MASHSAQHQAQPTNLVDELIRAIFTPELVDALFSDQEVMETLRRTLSRRCHHDEGEMDTLLSEVQNALEVEPDEHGHEGLRDWMIANPAHAAKKLITLLREF